jgi:hypothetical protein
MPCYNPPQTFSAQPPGNPGLVQVVRRHFHFYTVARGDFNPTLAHLAANGCQDDVIVRQCDAEHRAGKDRGNDAFDFNMLLFLLIHSIFLKVCTRKHFALQTSRAK